MLSSPLRTVAPVVVSPEMLSNKASVKDRCSCESMNGRLAAMAMLIHNALTSRKPNRRLKGAGRPIVVRTSISDRKPTTSNETRKTCQSGLPSMRSIASGASIAPLRLSPARPQA